MHCFRIQTPATREFRTAFFSDAFGVSDASCDIDIDVGDTSSKADEKASELTSCQRRGGKKHG